MTIFLRKFHSLIYFPQASCNHNVSVQKKLIQFLMVCQNSLHVDQSLKEAKCLHTCVKRKKSHGC